MGELYYIGRGRVRKKTKRERRGSRIFLFLSLIFLLAVLVCHFSLYPYIEAVVTSETHTRLTALCAKTMTEIFSKENYEFVIHDIEEQWTRMLRSNTDTFWETQKGADDFDYAGSLCHGWAAVPIYIFAHYQK